MKLYIYIRCIKPKNFNRNTYLVYIQYVHCTLQLITYVNTISTSHTMFPLYNYFSKNSSPTLRYRYIYSDTREAHKNFTYVCIYAMRSLELNNRVR